jgi:eukaryotic-like serine/threonine-protein kinase
VTLNRLKEGLADRYRIERELGQGGMATVYLAHDIRHERRVAVKVLRPELSAILGAERFLAEIKTTAHLQHPHILSLFDSGEADGLVFYVMPYVEGESLRDRLSREHQLPVEDAVRIAGEVASALDYAHRHGVVHRDIKPENILLHDGSALVADFGIALAVSRSDGGTRMTETGMSLGTPHYMAPEQAMGEREITPRADIYALGCVLYEMLAGEPPFTGPTAQAIIARVMTEEPRSLVLQRKSIPPHVEATALRALEKLPADRFGTAAQFIESLSRPGAVTAAAAPTVMGRVQARPRRWLALAPWGLAALAAGIAAWGWLGRAPEPRTSWHYLTLSDSITITTTTPSLALSPDGRSVLFKDSRQDGLLWIKRWDQLDATPIPGTERATGTTFSPDGAWIAYAADGRLKKVRAGGGSSVSLADSVAIQGAYNIIWLDDGSLVYTGAHLDVLYRSPSGGGAKVLLADSTLRGFGLQNLAPLPHARGVLFQSCGSGCVPTSIHVLDLRTGRQKLLLDDMIAAWYLPTGHLLYLRRDGVALAAPFDLERLDITGPAIPVLDKILPTAAAMLAWSPAGTLVYLQGGGSSNEGQYVRVNRQGLAVPVDSGWFGGFNSSELSPDGRRLAVGAGLAAGTLGIWIKQLDHGPFGRLSFGGQDRRPTWSPDGRMVAFIRDSGNGGSVYAHPADGSGGDRLLARIDRPIQEVAWSGDGRWLVLRTDNGAAGVGDLVGVRLTGDTAPVPLVATPFTELHPAISPDSKWLAYASNESGTNQVYVRPFPATAGGRWQVSNSGGFEPRWSRDGRELFFLTARQLVAAEVRTVPSFEVVRLQPLFDITGYRIDPFHQSYSVAPDGRSYLFTRLRPGTGPAAPRTVLVENWFADLRLRMRQ